MANKLYNGIELPDIDTVWTDKVTYPYAVIFRYNVTDKLFRLVLSTAPMKIDRKYNLHALEAMTDGSIIVYECTILATEWERNTEIDQTFVQGDSVHSYMSYLVEWCSFDLYYSDKTSVGTAGELFMEGSDPVPVLALTERDLYRKINGKPTKLTLYKKVSGELVALDEYTQGGNL
jgi:hypothetical protein